MFSIHIPIEPFIKLLQPPNLGQPNRLKKRFLDSHPVDCLLIEGETCASWIPWILGASDANRPQAILSFINKDTLDHDDGPLPKAQRKILQKLGYDVRYWYLNAWELGAALDLSTVGMVWYRTEDPTAEIPVPRSSALPVRPMNNLLKPFGIPAKAWAKRTPKPITGSVPHGPCQVRSHINGEPVYEELGAMLNEVGRWISMVKGTRRLQYEELAKAKGINEILADCGDKSARPPIQESVGIHLWSAGLDALGLWLCGPTTDDDTAPTPLRTRNFLPGKTFRTKMTPPTMNGLERLQTFKKAILGTKTGLNHSNRPSRASPTESVCMPRDFGPWNVTASITLMKGRSVSSFCGGSSHPPSIGVISEKAAV
jgi:hypothetical protein